MSKKIVKSSKSMEKKTWQNVKIKGKVISDDGGGLEGLIGLEVLEKYDPKFVSKDKKKNRKRKSDENDSGIDDTDGDLSKKTSRPKKAKKLDKKHTNEPKSEFQEFTTNENSSDSKQIKQKRNKQSKNTNKQPDEDIPGRYVRLHRVESNDEDFMDNLEGWNGLGVPDNILRALSERGFKSPTEIQKLTLPAAIMGKKDILGAAETGSGKTLAFGIPIISGIMELKKKDIKSGIRKAPKKSRKDLNSQVRDNLTPPPEELSNFPEISDEEKEDNGDKMGSPLYAIVLTPTRELAVQVRDHLIAAAKYTGISVAAIFGGMAIVKQERVLKKCPEIVVATPGRFWELLIMENPHLSKIDDISFLVIDETDRMVEKGHFDELRLLLRRLNSEDGKKATRQNFVFSATLTLVHDLPEHLQKKNQGRKKKLLKQTSDMKIQSLIDELGISQPKIVDITNSSQTASKLTESRLVCQMDQKDFYLYYFIQRHPGRTIVFCNSIDCVKRLGTLFGLLNCNPLPLHANMIQKQRLKNLERFRDEPNGLLIATDVAARGLDIQNVQHVIHYQVPRTSENYVHRSGRTARANKDGITVIFMDPGEIKSYIKLCKTLDRTEDLPLFPVSERHLNVVKERINLAREVDKLELKIRRVNNEIGWMKKNATEMEIVLDGENEESSDDDALKLEKSQDRRYLANRRLQLTKLLEQPLFPRGFSYKYPTSSGKLVIPKMHAESSDGNSAVTVMKQAIEDLKMAKKLRNKKKNH